jgi:hypothetical protein
MSLFWALSPLLGEDKAVWKLLFYQMRNKRPAYLESRLLRFTRNDGSLLFLYN